MKTSKVLVWGEKDMPLQGRDLGAAVRDALVEPIPERVGRRVRVQTQRDLIRTERQDIPKTVRAETLADVRLVLVSTDALRGLSKLSEILAAARETSTAVAVVIGNIDLEWTRFKGVLDAMIYGETSFVAGIEVAEKTRKEELESRRFFILRMLQLLDSLIDDFCDVIDNLEITKFPVEDCSIDDEIWGELHEIEAALELQISILKKMKRRSEFYVKISDLGASSSEFDLVGDAILQGSLGRGLSKIATILGPLLEDIVHLHSLLGAEGNILVRDVINLEEIEDRVNKILSLMEKTRETRLREVSWKSLEAQYFSKGE